MCRGQQRWQINVTKWALLPGPWWKLGESLLYKLSVWGDRVNGKREDTGRDNGQRGVGQPPRRERELVRERESSRWQAAVPWSFIMAAQRLACKEEKWKLLKGPVCNVGFGVSAIITQGHTSDPETKKWRASVKEGNETELGKRNLLWASILTLHFQ